MLIKSKYLLFIPSLMLGSILTISSSSWFSAWMGLEINLMSFAPILINNLSLLSIESTIKYFIIQALASTMLIFFMFFSFKLNLFNLNTLIELMVTSILLLKAGIAPFHFWFPQVMSCSNWPQCLIILTWQKLAPLVLLSFLNNFIMILSVCLSAIVGAFGGMNLTSMKKILTYSSIIHSAWMLGLLSMNDLTWLSYFLSYCTLTLSVSYIFVVYNIDYALTPQIIKMSSASKLMLLMNFLSLAGLPPMLGFGVKLMALMSMVTLKLNTFMILLLIMSSFLALYFYLRVIYSSMFIGHSINLPIHSISLTKINFLLYSSISLFGVMLFPLMVLLI